MIAHKDYYYVWRRSDGYVNASNGNKPGRNTTDTFELLAEGEDWQAMRGVILVERGELQVDESARYQLHLTAQTRWLAGAEGEATTKQWSVDGAQLRALLWAYAAGDHEDLPPGSYFDAAEYPVGSPNFRLRGISRAGRLELVVLAIP
ncbi:hypothetical protein [Streptomyces sp. AC1-42T]|uniref:hypothetical protein n=1 Tax=Streptomyces sp. AC1-42T TaxID=2218665 RepID=UPI000DAF2A30|nr:hypothetical protein [Streptomyces sp. AC1-42T]PZT71472.1 hypothetical protein DNK55_32690 [Streptomyces sp. AC1-42T]